MKITIQFKLADMWVGLFWKTYWETGYKFWNIWICLIPTLPLCINFRGRKATDKDTY
jgi:hypothetical protein